MSDTCYCDQRMAGCRDVINCILDKSCVSLPVLMTACAIGYIYNANKKRNEIIRQVNLLEDDIKLIKKENLHLYDELRHVKSACSDTEVISSKDKSHVNRLCSFADDYSNKKDNHCGRKIKRKKLKRSSMCNENLNCEEIASCSVPSINQNKTLNYEPTRHSNFEFCPKFETSKLYQNKFKDECCLPLPDNSDQSYRQPIKDTKRNFCPDKRRSRYNSPDRNLKFFNTVTSCNVSLQSPIFDTKNDDNYTNCTKQFPNYSVQCNLDDDFDINCDYRVMKQSRITDKSSYLLHDDQFYSKVNLDRLDRVAKRIESHRVKMSQIGDRSRLSKYKPHDINNN